MAATLEPKELRPLLHQKLDQIPDAELEAVHKALLKLKAEQFFQEMAAGAEEDRLAGKHDPALVDAAIREHRARHPYR